MIGLALSLFLGAVIISNAIEQTANSSSLIENEAGEIVMVLTKGKLTIIAISEDGGRTWETTATHNNTKTKKKGNK